MALKWSHSVVQEDNFLCEAGAREQALKLALELGLPGDSRVCQRPLCPVPQRRSPRTGLHVGFAPDLELRIGNEDRWTFRGFRFPCSFFACGLTPWSGCQKIADMKRQTNSFGFLPVLDVRSDFNHEPHNPFLCANQFPAILQCKITDNYYNVPSRGVGQDDPVPDPDVIPDIAAAPPFAQDLQAIADHHEVFTDLDSDGAFRIRTWYLHHQDLLVNFHPRIIELEEDWRRWEDDIIGSWRDHLHAGASVYFHLASPDPPKDYMRNRAFADIVITQGNELPRKAGIVTVHYHGITVTPHSYAVAVSVEPLVSGWGLAAAADALQWCSQPVHDCAVWHGWANIPFDQTLRHVVHDGHSFVIGVSQRPALEDVPAEPSAAAEHDYVDEVDHHLESAPISDESVSTHDPEQELSVHVFRLAQADAHCFVRWTTYRTILHDVSVRLGIPRDTATAIHYLRATPAGIHEDSEAAVILQTVSDIPAGSEEKLILVDSEIHLHPLASGSIVPPVTTRQVWKVWSTLHRSQILLLLGLYDYCELTTDRCLIHHDGQLWSAQDRSAHALEHGAYIRVRVPPPFNESLDTETAIAISRDFALPAHQGHLCNVDRHVDAGDQSSFFQLTVCDESVVQLRVTPDHVVQPHLPGERVNPSPLGPQGRERMSRFLHKETLRDFLASSPLDLLLNVKKKDMWRMSTHGSSIILNIESVLHLELYDFMMTPLLGCLISSRLGTLCSRLTRMLPFDW